MNYNPESTCSRQITATTNKNEANNHTTHKHRYSILRPGGNDTCLIHDIIRDQEERKSINDIILSFYKNVEQVGFINNNKDAAEIIMGGGEFCGNATRSAAWEILNGQSSEDEEFQIKSSGVKGLDTLKAGVDKNDQAWAQMPIFKSTSSVKINPENPNQYTVFLDGITHIVIFESETLNHSSNEEKLKEESLKILEENNLISDAAAGVIFVEKSPEGFKIFPVVHVKAVNTLFYESACGSGSTALGLVQALKTGQGFEELPIMQPSGMPINVSIDFNGKEFLTASISGPIQVLQKGALIDIENLWYVIERIEDENLLNKYLENGELIKLYQDIFSKPPYEESYEPEEVKSLFKDYFKKGILFVSRTNEEIIGFSAAIPVKDNPNVANCISDHLDPNNTWYMADVGVKDNYRRKHIAKQMVLERIHAIPDNTTIVMRTSINNIASQGMYRSLGFEDIPGCFQEVQQKRTDGTILTDRRLFLYRDK